ncbi:MAG: PulJ/GspJ family protein [Pirellulales bacterium]
MSMRVSRLNKHTNLRGMTLTEMLVATTMTLVIMGVVVQLFGMVGNGVSASRASLKMSSELRAVGHTLRTDLNGTTAETLPPVTLGSDSGYLEIIEGPGNDRSAGVTQLTGDIDDILMFTTQSLGDPFLGKLGSNGDLIESPYAEVIWFCQRASTQPLETLTPPSTLYNLHRRQRLVMNYVGAGDFHPGTNSIDESLLRAYSDLSLRNFGGKLFPNGLSDLTKRENRFLHKPATFPFSISLDADGLADLLGHVPDSRLPDSRLGEDIVLTNVLAFDVRVYDPMVEIKTANSIALVPGDQGYINGGSSSVLGAYVDMGTPGAVTFNAMDKKSQLTTQTYDTWSSHYECNGINEDEFLEADQGMDWKDNQTIDDPKDPKTVAANGIIDDEAELETSPPYPVPLRGLEVRIRIYDASTRQVRQVTVRHTFVPH